MDIPPLVLHHYWRIPVSVSLYLFDFVILLLQAIQNSVEKTLYGIVLILIYTVVMDNVILIGSSRTEIKIVSVKSEMICEAILKDVDRGVTMLHGKGGFSQQSREIILSVISNRELPQVEKIVHAIDPEAFMIVSRITEVKGHGFSTKKQYQLPAAQTEAE